MRRNKTTSAQVRASIKYNKENTLTICLRLNKETDKDIIKALKLVDNKNGYIKDLIRADQEGK